MKEKKFPSWRIDEDTLDLVAEFQQRAKQTIFVSPDVSDGKVNLFRGKLMLEELAEYFKAIGYCNFSEQLLKMNGEISLLNRQTFPDLIGTFDALLDSQYVLDGTFIQLGFTLFKRNGFLEVHRSNMTKDFPPDNCENVPHKITKGKSYSPPDLKKVLGLP